MRVIERKELPEIEIHCDSCDSLLAYTKKDIKTISLLRNLGLTTCDAVTCPVCGKYVLIEKIN